MTVLTENSDDQLQQLCQLGERFTEARRYEEAIARYRAAMELLPEEQSDWHTSIWLLGSIGDAQFHSRNFEPARETLIEAMECPAAAENPFLMLRLGQCELELGHEHAAADYLTRALEAAGYDLFQADDPRYYQFLKTRLEPPEDGWPDDPPKRKWWQFWGG